MDRPTYVKPTVLGTGQHPEPVEAGCCLRTCGGSPGHSQSSLPSQSTEKLLRAMEK